MPHKVFCRFPVSRLSRNRKTPQSLERILLFLMFPDNSGRLECCKVGRPEDWKVDGLFLSFSPFPDTSTELSAAGAKRGVFERIRMYSNDDPIRSQSDKNFPSTLIEKDQIQAQCVTHRLREDVNNIYKAVFFLALVLTRHCNNDLFVKNGVHKDRNQVGCRLQLVVHC